MINTTDLKLKAAQYYADARYLLAFETLYELGIEEFIKYARKDKKKDWLVVSASASYFWEEFLIRENVFTAFFDSLQAEHLLHIYFTRYNKPSKELLKQVAQCYPDLLVRAVRLNRVFFNDQFLPLLLNLSFDAKSPWPHHQKIWKDFFEQEAIYWGEVDAKIPKIKLSRLDEIIVYTCFWLEVKQFERGVMNYAGLQHLGKTYSCFAELLIDCDKFSNHDFDEDKIYRLYLEAIASGFKGQRTENIIYSVLESISKWVNFIDLADIYCYDVNSELELCGSTVYLAKNPVAYYRWLVNGERYDLNQFRYFGLGSQFVDELINQKGIIIPGNNEREKEFNWTLFCQKWANMLFTDDLCIKDFEGNGQPINLQTELLRSR